jgi:hypothetical protein
MAIVFFSSFTFCFSGCERTIQIENLPIKSDTALASSAIQRSSYNWPIGRTSFDSIAPSPFDFFDATRAQAQEFIETQPLDQQLTEVFIPEGLTEYSRTLVHRVKLPRDAMEEVIRIPVSSERAVFAISRSGDRLAICEAGEISVWNVTKGSLEKKLSSKVENAERLVFDANGKSIFISTPTVLARVNVDDDQITATTSKFPSRIVQFAIASDLDKLVIRCDGGEILVTEGDLEKIAQYPKSSATSDVSISDKGDRIAFWNETTPTEIELDGLEFGRKEIVENLQYSGGERKVVCGRFTTQWLHGRQVFQWWHSEIGTPIKDRVWRKGDLTWNPVQLIATSPNVDSDSRALLAMRKTKQGDWQQVIAEVNCTYSTTSVAHEIPFDSKSICLNLTGSYVAYQSGKEVCVRKRVPWQFNSHESLLGDAMEFAMTQMAPEQLDFLGEFILKNNFWWKYGYSPQDVYTQFAKEMGTRWYYIETNKTPNEKTKQRLEALNKWYQNGSELALLSSGFRRRVIAWQALGGSDKSRFTYEAKERFDQELKKIRADISPLLRKPDPNNATYVLLLFYHLGIGSDLSEADAVLQKALTKHPECVEPLLITIPMLVERWRGARDDVAAFAREVRSLYGSELGSMQYPRMCIAVYSMFMESSNMSIYARMSMEQLIDGLISLSTRDAMSQNDYIESFRRLYSGRFTDAKLAPILDQYCRHNAFAPKREESLLSAPKTGPSNAGRYHVLRYVAQSFGEALPEPE